MAGLPCLSAIAATRAAAEGLRSTDWFSITHDVRRVRHRDKRRSRRVVSEFLRHLDVAAHRFGLGLDHVDAMLDQIADRYEADHPLAIDHGQMADPAPRHQ